MLRYATADASTPFERRVALLLSAHYGRCNPLALWPSLLRDDDRFAELFRRRIDASEASACAHTWTTSDACELASTACDVASAITLT